MTTKLINFDQWAPIALFVYKRLDHTQRTVEALLKNEGACNSELFIFSDQAKVSSDITSVKDVRKFIQSISGFKKVHIILRSENFGLSKSIIEGVSSTLKTHQNIIVLEDDIVTSPDFLKFINQGLNAFKTYPHIFSITGSNYLPEMPLDYPFDVFPFYRASSWGWATWKDRWQSADWEVKDFQHFIQNREMIKEFNRGGDDMTDTLLAYKKGKIDVWAIRWCYAHFKNQAFCIYPSKSKVTNIGLDGSGENCTIKSQKFFSKRHQKEINFDCPLDMVPESIERAFKSVHRYGIKNKLKYLIKKMIGYYKV